MLAYISAIGIHQYFHGAGAPVWRAIVTPGNSTALNAAAAAVSALALGYAALRFVQLTRQERTPFLWAMVSASFFCVPPLALHVTGLSPLMLTLLPVSLALASLMLPDFGGPRGADDDGPDAARGGWRMLLSGAFAALAAWEGTLGAALAPVLLLAIWLPNVCRETPIFRATTLWMRGFFAVLLVEGFCLGFDISALKPVPPPMTGLAVFACIGLLPVLIVVRLGWNRVTAGVWGGVLAIFLTVTLAGGYYWSESEGERFARTVLAELGGRKLIVGDGITDDYFMLLKPADVRLAGMRTDEDREFLLNAFEDGEPVTNRALVVSRYHGLPEMERLARKLGIWRGPSGNGAAARPAGAPVTNAIPAEVAISNVASRVARRARPLMELLAAAEAEFGKPQAKRDRATLEKAREEIRKALMSHVYGGTRLSHALIMADLLLGDTRSAASDAISVLMADREDPAANTALGALRQEEGRLDLAERYLRRGVRGGGALAMGKLAILLVQTDRPQEAVEWARKAVELIPDDCSFREPLAAALIESGRFDEAEAELDEIARSAKANGQAGKEMPFLSGARKRLAERRKGK